MPAVAIIAVPLGVLVILQVLFLIALMSPQLLALVSLVMAQFVGIAVAIMLFQLMASESFSLSPLVAVLAPPFAPLSYAQNRVEPVSFNKTGRFLVICAVLPHLNDGMFAWVEVRNRGHHDDDDDHHH